MALTCVCSEDGYTTDVTPTNDDVYRDFDQMRRQMKIKSFAGKWVQRKYAFGTEGIPDGESKWLKVVYDFQRESCLFLFCSQHLNMADLQNLNCPKGSRRPTFPIYSAQIPARSSCSCSSVRLWGHVGSRSKTQYSDPPKQVYLAYRPLLSI